MAVRVYLCPVVGSGTRHDPYRSKANDYDYNPSSTLLPFSSDGTPADSEVVTVVYSNDFSAIDADAECVDLFDGAVPDTDVAAELVARRGDLADRAADVAVLVDRLRAVVEG